MVRWQVLHAQVKTFGEPRLGLGAPCGRMAPKKDALKWPDTIHNVAAIRRCAAVPSIRVLVFLHKPRTPASSRLL
jgi:hypothetical protein